MACPSRHDRNSRPVGSGQWALGVAVSSVLSEMFPGIWFAVGVF